MTWNKPEPQVVNEEMIMHNKLDWKQIELSAIDRIGTLIKEDLVKWALAIDYLEALLPEITEDEDYQKELEKKIRETNLLDDEGQRIKQLYKWKFGTIIRRIRKSEPLDIVGQL